MHCPPSPFDEWALIIKITLAKMAEPYLIVKFCQGKMFYLASGRHPTQLSIPDPPAAEHQRFPDFPVKNFLIGKLDRLAIQLVAQAFQSVPEQEKPAHAKLV
jgi:hypothetical protein